MSWQGARPSIAATILAPLLLLVNTLWMLYVLLPICMVAANLGMPMLTPLVGDALPMGDRGTGYGTYGLIRDISFIVAPVISGVTLELLQNWYGVNIAGGIYVLFILRTLVLALAMLATMASIREFQIVDSVVWMRTKVPAPETPQ